MKINIKVMKESAYETLANNPKKVFDEIKKHPYDPSWLKDFVGEDPFETRPYFVDDFELLYDDNYDKVAYQNGIVLYEHLIDNVPGYILYDARFWAWIVFEKGYRQSIQSVELSSYKTIGYSWFPKTNGRRQLLRGTLSREFIKVKMSIDESRDDKYELTKCLFKNRTLYIMLLARNISDIPNFCHAVLDIANSIYVESGHILTRDESETLLKIGCKIGSVRLVDVMDYCEIREALIVKYKGAFPYLFP